MEPICKESNEEIIEKKSTEEDANNHLSNDVTFGDVIWVKLNESSWWPAQVFDEDSMSVRCNPSKKANGEVLVRLYGSYKYLYVDQNTSHLEFISKLKEKNGKYHEIMMESINKDLACIKSGRSKKQTAKTKANGSEKVLTKTPPTKGKNSATLSQQTDKHGSRKRKQGMQKKLESDGTKSEPTSEENSKKQPSARKMKILQKLALVPPPGSPFLPNYTNED